MRRRGALDASYVYVSALVTGEGRHVKLRRFLAGYGGVNFDKRYARDSPHVN